MIKLCHQPYILFWSHWRYHNIAPSFIFFDYKKTQMLHWVPFLICQQNVDDRMKYSGRRNAFMCSSYLNKEFEALTGIEFRCFWKECTPPPSFVLVPMVRASVQVKVPVIGKPQIWTPHLGSHSNVIDKLRLTDFFNWDPRLKGGDRC